MLCPYIYGTHEQNANHDEGFNKLLKVRITIIYAAIVPQLVAMMPCLFFLLDAQQNYIGKALENDCKYDESQYVIPQPSNLPPKTHNLLSTINSARVVCAGREGENET